MSEENDTSDEMDERDSSVQSDDSASEEDGVPALTHAVTFKCMGSVKDSTSQGVLRKASSILNGGGEVSVQLKPEPTNPKDAKAIAFECKVDGKWERCQRST